MKRSETAAVLAKVRLYDGRQPEASLEQVDAWMELHFIKANDFETVARAVTLFYEQPTDPSGRSPYLDTHQLRRFISVAKREKELAQSRVQAIEATERRAIEAPADDRTIAQMIEANPIRWSQEPHPDCSHPSVGISEGGGFRTWTCNKCLGVVKEEAV